MPRAAERLELLRAAHAAEHTPARRARLARRLAEALEADGDALGAVAVLEAVVAEAAGSRMPARGGGRGGARDAEWARLERVRLLRSLGRARELAAALERDAGALAGDARLAALAELATLLDRGGEPEKALEIRRMALAEFPGAPNVLVEARRHLEATGRAAESLALAHAALESAVDPERRRALLRDVARLTEQLGASVNAAAAADAWLAVLDSDPADAAAAAAAERFLVATGDWERCAELLAWRAARTARTASIAGRTCGGWRSCVGRASARSTRPPGSTSSWRRAPRCRRCRTHPRVVALARQDPALAVDTTRAAAAPTPADRARALADRARALAERGRVEDARRDVLAALDSDPRNGEALRLLDTLYPDAVSAAALVARARAAQRQAAARRRGPDLPRPRPGGGAVGRPGRGARSLPARDGAGSDAGGADRRAGAAGGQGRRLVASRGAAGQ